MNLYQKLTTITLVVLLIGSIFVSVQSQPSPTPSDDDCGCANTKFSDNNHAILSSFPPLTKEDLATSIPYPQPTMSFAELPSYFSWKSNGGNWLTPVKHQGNCGSCFAFSTIGALEAAIDIASHNPSTNIDLSEQYVLSCLPSAGDCNGGWMHSVIGAIRSTSSGSIGNGINGCPVESCMPYTATDYFPCSDKCNKWDYVDLSRNGKLWEIQAWAWTSSFDEDDPNDWNIMKTWIMKHGPLSVDIFASEAWIEYGFSHNDIDNVYQQDDSGQTNHGVVLLGWKDDPSITNGGYWILKNSWGTSFGYGGFFNVAYGCLGIGTRCCLWVTTPEWEDSGENDMKFVSSSFSFISSYPKPEETVYFKDESSGPVALRDWDFNNDNIIDSNEVNPSYTFPDVGDYPVNLTVWNENGLSSTSTRIVSVKTIWPPIAMAEPSYYGCDNPKVDFDGSLSWDTDGYITQYEWDIGNGETIYGRSPTYTFPNTGKTYNVTLTVTDDSGATDSAKCEICIDIDVPPTTSLDIGYGISDQRCFKNPVTIGLTANDWTGVKNSYYRINADTQHQEFTLYREPFELSKEGTHNIDFYSIDTYGNQESTKSEQIILDFTPPTLNNPDLSGKLINGWYKTPVAVSLKAADDLSGINKILYIIDDEVLPISYWNEYNCPFFIGKDGTHTLRICAIDKAGNLFTSDTLRMKIDIDNYPSASITNPKNGIYIKDKRVFPFPGISLVIGDITIVAEVETPYNEMQPDSVEFYIDDVLCHTSTTSPFEWLWSDTSGTHTIMIKATVNGYTNTFKDETKILRLI